MSQPVCVSVCVCVCGVWVVVGGCVCVCVCVCVVCVFGKGVVSTRLTGLDGTSSAEATQMECTLDFTKGHLIDSFINYSNNYSFSGLQRSTRPVIASPQISVPLIS